MDVKSWAKKIDWEHRIKAVCKPCWEIKYCPYGPLVENMKTQDEDVEKICKIFGHVCPVFVVAEPFTETKELRTISRNIPREVQLRVSRRDNNVCQICSKNVLDKDIHFDHIIPWSKGGSSDENNIRILCPKCNLERSNNFENELLVTNFKELACGLININQIMLYDIIVSINEINYFRKDSEFVLTFDNIVSKLNLTEDEKEIAEIVFNVAFELDAYILNYMEGDFKKSDCEKIKYRFGYNKKIQSHTLEETAKRYNVSINNIKKLENKVLNYIGFKIEYIEDEEELLENDELIIKDINDREFVKKEEM